MRLSWENEVDSHWSSFVLQDSWTCPWIWWGIPVSHCKEIDNLFHKSSFFSPLLCTYLQVLQTFFVWIPCNVTIRGLQYLLDCSDGSFCECSHYHPLHSGRYRVHKLWHSAHFLPQYAYFSDERTIRCPSWSPCQLELHYYYYFF